MKFHKQLIKHEADKQLFGDCHRTALACLLDLEDPSHAPHFIGTHEQLKLKGEHFDWEAAQERWLNDLGYTTARVAYDGSTTKSQLFDFMAIRNPHTLYLIGGESPRGFNHTVIALGGGFFHDPHPDGGYLVGPMDNGLWEIDFLLPVSMKVVR